MERMHRFLGTKALTTSETTTPVIDTRQCAGVGYRAIDAIVSVEFYVAAESQTTRGTPGTKGVLKDRVNVAVTQTCTQGACYPFPDECFAWPFVYMKANTAGSIELTGKS